MTLPTGDIDNLSVSASYTTTGHTGIAVPVFAFGPGAVEFTGVYQNTGIFDKNQVPFETLAFQRVANG
ncbi:MAG: hypothetical protein R2744_00525 [Bacteroidales bacterium]